jgi:hypothetical protein
MQDFTSNVIDIDKQIKDLTWAGGLFNYVFFRKVHGEPGSYVDNVKSALSEKVLTEQQKIITVLMLQDLPFDDYLDFCEVVVNMLEKKQITYNIFRWAVFPGYEWNTFLADKYISPRVGAIMYKLLRSENIEGSLKRYIQEEILTGKAKKQVEYLRDIGQIK